MESEIDGMVSVFFDEIRNISQIVEKGILIEKDSMKKLLEKKESIILLSSLEKLFLSLTNKENIIDDSVRILFIQFTYVFIEELKERELKWKTKH